jgi:hypothetical protein
VGTALRSASFALLALLGAAACGPPDPPQGEFLDNLAALSPGDAGAPDAEGGSSAGDRISLDGTWALWTETSSCLKLGVQFESLTEAVGLAHLDAKPGSVVAHTFRNCIIEQTPILGLATVIPRPVVDSIPVRTFVAVLDGTAVGSAYMTQLDVELWAVNLSDPYDEALPTTGDDPRVYDQDGDGKPGATLVLGNDACRMYVVQRGLQQWKGTVLSPTSIAGGGISTSEQKVLGATSGFCATQYDVWYPNGAARFALVRVDGKHGAPNLDGDGDGVVSCDEVRAWGTAPFGPRKPDNERCNQPQ